MRIAHIITRMIVGGAQENTLFNCLDLIEQFGDEVLLITGPALGPEGDLMRQGRGPNVPTRYLPSLRRAIHPWRDWQAYRDLRGVLAEFQPDVVHTHSAKGGFLGRLAAAAQRVPAIVHTVHGAPFHPYQNIVPRTVYRWLETYAARRCHALISVADAMTAQLTAAGVAPPEKFTTIYSGMDVEPFLAAPQHRERTRQRLGYQPGQIVIGKIARLFHLKGHADILAAAARLRPTHPSARFLFIGNGILRDSLQRRIDELGLTDMFQFTGLVPPSQIPELLSAMDILVHASLREGLARALPQALLAGKPIISYDIDGAREVCITGETGFLVPPRDISALTLAMKSLLADQALRDRLAETGRQRFAQQFRHQYMTERIRELYARVLAEHGISAVKAFSGSD